MLGAVGRTEEALAALQEGLDAARALGDAWWIAYGLAHLSAVRAARGELEAALDASREAVALAARHGVGYPLILARTHLLWQQVLASPGHPAHAAEIAAARAAAEALGLQGLAVFLTWVGLLHRVADPTVVDDALAGELAAGITLYRARAPLKGSWETLALRVREGVAACRPGVALVDLDALVDEVVAQKAESLDLEEREAFRASRRARTVSLTAWRGW